MVKKDVLEPSAVIRAMKVEYFPELMAKYPGIKVRLDGMSEESEQMEASLFVGFTIALFGIYALLAIPLRSYAQPLIIMSVIPFGIIGAAIGHMIMGMPISMMSIFGIIALSGVVVNDSLIMVDFVNRAIAKGEPLVRAVIDAGCQRFRAILLTSVTTFFGILPLLTEDAAEADFVLPMATSLGFGIVFATVITLILVPCLYVILEDLGMIEKQSSDRVALASAEA
jgi:multidrug efflux pump subunit AcrB